MNDPRSYPVINVEGTRTGRLDCSRENTSNTPKGSVKDLLKSVGFINPIISVDYPVLDEMLRPKRGGDVS